MALRFYNTLTRKKEVFKPREDKRVDLFVCGPTVYDRSHIGHARTYIVFDIFVRYLRSIGLKVSYLQNITDIEDKIIVRAQKIKQDPRKLARKEEQNYRRDMTKLGIESVDRYARASEHIPQIISQVRLLLEKGHAYETKNGVYFDITTSKDYGKLSHQNIRKMKAAVRIEKDPHKRHAVDFVLWKNAKPGEPVWASPWGPGRPGWHIEDTAIAEKYFGQQYDLHGGALDLIFPHHESEIAQMEAISGKKPYVRFWLHAGFLTVKGTKMAKSLGNFITIEDMLAKHRKEAFRLLTIQTHYRSPIEYTDDLMEQAEAAVDRLAEFRERLKQKKMEDGKWKMGALLKTVREKFFAHLQDDFNTPKALGALFTLVRTINPLIDKNTLTKKDGESVLELFRDADALFGILPKEIRGGIPAHIQRLVGERERMRKQKQWPEADTLREKIKKMGYVVEDTDYGPHIKHES